MKSQSKFVNSMRQEDARTVNGALTNSTSLNSIVDLFFIAGASRSMDPSDIKSMLTAAWVDDKVLTLRLIFWAGDIRGGAGERRFFRIALEWLHKKYPKFFEAVYTFVPEYNRWDSLFSFQEKNILQFIYHNLVEEKDGLLAKWMPRKKQYNNFASAFRKAFEMSHKEYRKLIVSLSDTVEQKMCAKEFKAIEYSAVPSVAMSRYRNAFYRNDEDRFSEYITAVTSGEEKINASAIFPHDVIKSYLYGDDRSADAIVAQWNALPDYLADTDIRFLPVCDVSGSMCGLPMTISVALGLYLSERNQSVFKDAFITFSKRPEMQYLVGTLTERIDQLSTADWGMNTNLTAVFDLVLSKAIDGKIDPEDMPDNLLIISDMEFDSAVGYGRDDTNYNALRDSYSRAGFTMPQLVFWNVNGRRGNVPVSEKTKNVALVSGASPSIIKSILTGKDFTPVGIMKETLNDERYDPIVSTCGNLIKTG